MVEIRDYIAGQIGVNADHIDLALDIPDEGFSIYKHIIKVSRKGYVWPTYKVNYKYRDGHKICTKWAETWTEGCKRK